jgi:dihydroxyacid dehydratase/phosphogluconate dehydratase
VDLVGPEAAVGSPIAMIEDGDMIEIEADHRVLLLRIDNEMLAASAGNVVGIASSRGRFGDTD